MKRSLTQFLARTTVPPSPAGPAQWAVRVRRPSQPQAPTPRGEAGLAVPHTPAADAPRPVPSSREPRIYLDQIAIDRLYSYQFEPCLNLAYALKRFGAALDASDTGTGKTYTACGVAKTLKLKIAVVCPKSVIPAWERVIADFGLHQVFVLNYEKLRGGRTEWCIGRSFAPNQPLQNGYRVTHQRDPFRWNLPPNTLLIFDEAHRCKGANSLNSKLMIMARVNQVFTLALSATAAANPTEMKALGFLLRLFDQGQYWAWCKRYGCVQGAYGGNQFNGDQRILLGLHRQIFPNRGSRIRIADLGDAFPERIISAESYNLGSQAADVRAAYDEMEDALAMLDERTRDYAIGALTAMMKARQRSELLKVPMMADMASDLVEEGNSVAIFVNFTETITQLTERLSAHLPGVIMGGQTDVARQAHIDDFQADRKRIIIANIRAGGVGISLHDLNGNYPRVGLVCPTFSAIDLVQVLGRLHRAGARSRAVYRIIFAAATVEEDACRAVRGKLTNLAALNDGDLRAGIQLNLRNG